MDIENIPFSPLKVVHDIFSVLNPKASEEGVHLELFSDFASEALVVGDPGRLRQILTNLIGNSIKFTGAGGSVSVTMENSGPRKTLSSEMEDVKSPTSSDGPLPTKEEPEINIRFQVKDTGIGISEDAMKGLFRPFSQADSSTARTFGGTGLGLTICRQLVTLMGGSIELRSKPGVGTLAIIDLPFGSSLQPHGAPQQQASPLGDELTDAPLGQSLASNGGKTTSHPRRQVHPGTNEAQQLSATERKHMTILVVEDNPVNRKIVCLSINKLGFKSMSVNNGQEALDYLSKSSNHPRPDLILMDVMMPICDGYQATYSIRNDTQNFDEEVRSTPIIALTASVIKGDREKCVTAGMNDFLKKPVARDHLERSLLKWLSRKKAS